MKAFKALAILGAAVVGLWLQIALLVLAVEKVMSWM